MKRDAFVYAIAIDAPGAAASTRVNPGALRDLTTPTGGYTEVVREAADLGPATERIAEELNSQYTIGYAPSEMTTSAARGRLRRSNISADCATAS